MWWFLSLLNSRSVTEIWWRDENTNMNLEGGGGYGTKFQKWLCIHWKPKNSCIVANTLKLKRIFRRPLQSFD